MVTYSYPKVTYSYPKVTYSYPRVTYCDPKVTYSDPKMTYSDPKVTHSDPTHMPLPRGVAGKSFAGRQEVVALENYWIACKDLPMALDSMINSTMAT